MTFQICQNYLMKETKTIQNGKIYSQKHITSTRNKNFIYKQVRYIEK